MTVEKLSEAIEGASSPSSNPSELIFGVHDVFTIVKDEIKAMGKVPYFLLYQINLISRNGRFLRHVMK